MSTAVATPALAASAAYYARTFGWRVFPLHTAVAGRCSCGRPDCGNPGKHPRTGRGFKDATVDGDTIARWWSTDPDSNIGVATGGVSGFFVVDVDPRNGGDVTLDALEDEHGKLPATVESLTGGGGRHILFRYPAGATVRSGKLGTGLDLKADGGYIVGPPSLHASGRQYGWEGMSRPGEVEIADAPAWLLARVTSAPADPGARRPSGPLSESFLYLAFAAAGLLVRAVDAQRHAVLCPWRSEHTSQGETSTVLFAPSEGRTLGWFHCSHSHCADRTIDDVVAALPPAAVATARRAQGYQAPRSAPAPEPAPGPTDPDDGWRGALVSHVSKQGVVTLEKCTENVAIILTRDPRWAGVIALNAFTSEVVTRREPPWSATEKPAEPWTANRPWTDADDTRLELWLSREWQLRVGVESIVRCVAAVAERAAYHPVREYLDGLTWDGVPRLARWMATYLGAAPSQYVQAVGVWWMVAAVARIYQPGCKADNVPILEGSQGAGKSAALRILAGEAYFSDTPLDLQSKDAFAGLRGRWIVEFAELDALRKADTSRAKAFFSSPVDTYREAYARRAARVARQCVFAGTVNHGAYLSDDTGNRRFWPVRCGRIDTDALRADRDQLWAEAVAEYREGRAWWPTDRHMVEACADEQEERYQADEWEPVVGAWLARSPAEYITTADVLTDCLHIEVARWDRATQMRVGSVLRRCGRERRKVRVGARFVWGYFRAPTGERSDHV